MKTKTKYTILLINILLIILMVILLVNNKLEFFDNYFYNTLMLIKSNFVNNYFKIITKLADPIVLVILSIMALLLNKRPLYYLVGLISVSTLLNSLLKQTIKRVRPININMIIEKGYSFPSGHSMASVSFYGFIIYLIYKSNLSSKLKLIVNTILSIIIISICLSRIYLGVHFASDVIVGVIISSSLILITTIIKEKREI